MFATVLGFVIGGALGALVSYAIGLPVLPGLVVNAIFMAGLFFGFRQAR